MESKAGGRAVAAPLAALEAASRRTRRSPGRPGFHGPNQWSRLEAAQCGAPRLINSCNGIRECTGDGSLPILDDAVPSGPDSRMAACRACTRGGAGR